MEEFILDPEGQERLVAYYDRIGSILGNEERRASFATYATGLFGEGARKSMEPIAARACPDASEVDAGYQRIQHFVTDSRWSDHDVRAEAARYGLSAMTVAERVTHWIIDDTGFLKQGKHSVGVKRQYTGSAGKVTNCQVGVSLTIATATQHLPIDFALYLPHEWADDPERRKEARIPDGVRFKTKLELALEMIEVALRDGIAPGRVVVDAAYGNSSKFRRRLRGLGLSYAVGVQSTTKVWELDSLERRKGQRTLTLAALANETAEAGGFRRITWREGTKKALSSRFAMRRVLPIADEGIARAERQALTLLMEWEDGEPQPNKFHFISDAENLSQVQLVRHVKQRWRTERAYEDLKGQLGLDHFEGRRYTGWHHHMSVVLVCSAFLVAEHARHFPPQARRTSQTHPHIFAAGASFRGLDHHRAARHRPRGGPVASALPVLPSPQRTTTPRRHTHSPKISTDASQMTCEKCGARSIPYEVEA